MLHKVPTMNEQFALFEYVMQYSSPAAAHSALATVQFDDNS